jgi:hypothetical protein
MTNLIIEIESRRDGDFPFFAARIFPSEQSWPDERGLAMIFATILRVAAEQLFLCTDVDLTFNDDRSTVEVRERIKKCGIEIRVDHEKLGAAIRRMKRDEGTNQ